MKVATALNVLSGVDSTEKLLAVLEIKMPMDMSRWFFYVYRTGTHRSFTKRRMQWKENVKIGEIFNS